MFYRLINPLEIFLENFNSPACFCIPLKVHILLARTHILGKKKSIHFNRKFEFCRKRLHVVPRHTGRNIQVSQGIFMPTMSALQKQNLWFWSLSLNFQGSWSCQFLPPCKEHVDCSTWHWTVISTRFFIVSARDTKR